MESSALPAHRSAFRRILPWLLTLAPGVIMLLLVLKHMVNIPFLDDWAFVDMDEKAAAGTLTMHDFFAGHMEHRVAWLRAVLLLIHKMWPGDYTKETLLTFLFLPGTAWMVHLLMKRTTGEGFRAWWPVMLLMNLAIFTPVQYQIILWPLLFQVTCLTFFLGTILVSLMSKLPLWARFLIGLGSLLCGLLSFGTGIIFFIIPIPLIVLADIFPSKRSRWIYLAVWLATFAVTSYLYFHDLKNEAEPRFANKQEVGDDTMLKRDIMEIFHRPGAALLFVLRMLGTHLARGSGFAMMDQGLVMGAICMAVFWLGVWFWWANRKDRKLHDAVLLWLCYGSYSIGSAILIAMGRLKETASGDNALSARYVIHAVPLTVALLAILWFMARHFSVQRPALAPRIRQISTGLVTAYVMMQTFLWAYGARCMEVWSSSRLRNATNTLFFKTRVPIEQDLAPNRVPATHADDLGLLDPPMLQDRRLDNFSIVRNFANPNNALLDTVDFDIGVDRKMYLEVRGYACLDRRQRVADGVFLTYRDKTDGHWEIFYILQVRALPLYLADTIGRDLQHIFVPGRKLQHEALAAFSTYADLADLMKDHDLPEGDNEIMAWAYDGRHHQVAPMQGLFRFNAEKQETQRLDEKWTPEQRLQFLQLEKQKRK